MFSFTLPSLTFKLLYVFVVLSHDCRPIMLVNVTQNSTAEVTAQHFRDGFPGDNTPTYWHRDRDSISRETLRKMVKSMRIKES